MKSAIELAEITTEDPHAGLPDAEELGTLAGDLRLYSAGRRRNWRPRVKIETAKRAEDAALSTDPRISNSEGASFDTHVGRHIFANSRGFAGEYRTSYCSLSTSPVARDGEIHGARLLVHHGARIRRAGGARSRWAAWRRSAPCGG